MRHLSSKLILGFLIVLFLEQPTPADEYPDSFEELSLEQMIEYARIHSPFLQEAEGKVQLAELDVLRTNIASRLIPSMSLSWGSNLEAMQGSRLIEEQTTFVRLSWDLDRLFNTGRYDHREAKLKLETARRELKNTHISLIRDITKTYLLWKGLKRKATLYNQKAGVLRELMEFYDNRYKTQEATLDQLQSARIEFYGIESMRLDNEDEQVIVLQELMELTGWDRPWKRVEE